jgi:hypothetical protein
MAERESIEIDEAKIQAPPARLLVADPQRRGEMERSVEVILTDFPAPNEIIFDLLDVDAPVPTIKAYEQAAQKCSEYSYAFGGLATVYKWLMGQCFERIRQRLAPQGKWMEWYQHHDFDKSEVSRDIRLFKAVTSGPKALIGMSQDAAHRKFVRKGTPKTKPTIPMSPSEKDAEASKGWLPCPIQPQVACRHKIGPVTSAEIVEAVNFLRNLSESMDTLELRISAESLAELTEPLEGVKKRLPKAVEADEPELRPFQPEQVPV